MPKLNKKFKKVVVLDTVIFYPEHRELLNSIAEEVLEYPTSLPDKLEKQYEENPSQFLNKKCYTELAIDDVPNQLLMNRIDGADVVISCWTGIPDEILKLNPQLKLVVFWTHEKEHRINLDLAEELGIAVTNVPDYGTYAVSEVVFSGLWQLLKRNFGAKISMDNGKNIAKAVIDQVFTHFRGLLKNEKYTRKGKFVHHFHKIGQMKFDFDEDDIDDLIPEQLVKHKRVGLLNIDKTEETKNILESFGIICDEYNIEDSSLATFYKFLAENDLVFYQKSNIEKDILTKVLSMFGDKIINIQKLKSSDFEIDNKKFGVVGLGRIGKEVAKIAKNLGFEVIYYSKTKKPEIEKKLGIKYSNLEDLSKESDIISLHVPAYKAEGLFDKEMIDNMKDGAMFINTADGNAVDQHHLTKRMKNKEIFSYLDVYPGLPRKDVLGLSMKDKSNWKIHDKLSNNVLAYRAGWKSQESIRVKTYKLLGEMIDCLIGRKNEYKLPEEL